MSASAAAVAPGGRLVYAVCSLEPEEGEAQAAAFLDRHSDFARAAVGSDELPGFVAPSEDGHVRTLPTMLPEAGRLDGFFIARFEKAA